jgi:hypothetical protein
MGILNSKLCLRTLAAMGLLLSVSSSAQQGTASLAEQKDACVEHGPHLRYDPVAADAARSAVQVFLRSLFKLERSRLASVAPQLGCMALVTG